jgi:cysteinyl-tRNA synthetase
MLAAFGLILPPTSLQQDDIPEEILRLASQRWDARLARDWVTSDLLRAELDALGWIMKDGKTSWELTRK